LESSRGVAISRTAVTQDRDSRFHSLHFSFGGRILRHDLNVVLSGEGAETELDGLYAVKSGRHIDHHTVVEHAVPHTRSRQVYKGIIHDGGKSAFNGKILVCKDAQQTDAAQLNKNLLLGDKAEANTKPELMILADDVKCSHGATVGQLNADEVFYLESRAIPRELATKMLVRGFAEDVLNRIEAGDTKEYLKRILMEEFF
jgi:Fe-S cluster assembly protein SufD